MRDKVAAIIRVAVAMLLYPAALAALVWIAWTGRPVWMGIGVVAIILMIDRTWIFILRRLLSLNPNK